MPRSMDAGVCSGRRLSIIMCRVIVPVTSIEPGVLDALQGVPYEVHDVSSDDEAYWRLLDELWRHGDDFAIVEQDIQVRTGTLASFEECPNGWCAASYRYLGSTNYAGLGCTRFRAEFIAEHPDLIKRAGEYHDELHPRRHWCVQDAAMQFALRDRRQFACVDHGTVEHLGDCRPSHGCC